MPERLATQRQHNFTNVNGDLGQYCESAQKCTYFILYIFFILQIVNIVAVE